MFPDTKSQIQDGYGQQVLLEFKVYDWLQKRLSQKSSDHMGSI